MGQIKAQILREQETETNAQGFTFDEWMKLRRAGIKALVELNAAVGIKITPRRARTKWRKMDATKRQRVLEAYANVDSLTRPSEIPQ